MAYMEQILAVGSGNRSSGVVDEGEVEARGLALEVPDLAVAALGLEVGDLPRDVFLAAGQHGVDEAGELVGGRLAPGTTVIADRRECSFATARWAPRWKAQLQGWDLLKHTSVVSRKFWRFSAPHGACGGIAPLAILGIRAGS